MNAIPLLSAAFLLLPTADLSGPPSTSVEWVYSMADAKAQAASVNKPILVYCWSEGSDYCGKLYQETLNVDGAALSLGQFVCFSAKHGGDGVQEVFEHYGVQTLPTMLFLTPKGEAEDLIQGFIPVDDFAGEVERIGRGEGTVSGLQSQVDSAADGTGDDIEARYALAGKVQALGQGERHDELMASIKSVDPKGKTLIGARLRMQEIVRSIVSDGDGDGDGDGQDGGKDGQDGYDEENEAKKLSLMRKWDLAPLHSHAKLVPLAEARHETWNQIGNMEVNRRDMQAAFDAFHKAWKTCPEDKVVDWSNNIARWIVKNGKERTSKEKKFALELAETAMKTLKKRLKNEKPTGDDKESAANYTAYCWNTIAWCQHLNGKQGLAVKAAKKAIALHETDEYSADLKKFTED